jgi:hypothetical protein
MFFTLCYKYVKQKLYNMKNEFDERGLEILRKLLPKCSFEKNGDTLLVKKDNKTLECKADFGQLFKLIDDDRLLRQQDSAEFYWEHFGKVIDRELNKS